ncbi:hypothetical protein FKG94_21360 [Exilibacterium tricleocarpae]|uniref:Putative heavy-metal chelation domain-containing protein n=1 Tax=Exilibacterium tricleocarpae TaxID=2591008 RepID=A0A545T026_9GAMM|nr:DUF364 domain-containing protein [Exilibacterium tricleocarpae]TQV70572.1 hypothetical protein FKG94_21360 [Exilibacterium tricleocarpae]
MTANASASAESFKTVDQLIDCVLQRHFGIDPRELPVVGAFEIDQSTQFPGTEQKYRNYYLLLRVNAVFGGCCVEAEQLEQVAARELVGQSLAALLEDARLPVRVAALDAYLGVVLPHRDDHRARELELPYGTPFTRAVARDKAIVSLLAIEPDQAVGLIGVVNPIVQAIEARGARCLPCDFNMQRTAGGLVVQRDMRPVLEQADFIIATGMTLSNGSFDEILAAARRRNIPLVVYAQTGSAIVPRFLGQGVSAVSAEPFPYSQFSADPTAIYLYRAANP